MSQGQDGGLAAARKLTERIRQFMSAEGFEQYQLWVYLFYHKRGLLDTFGRMGWSTVKTKFDEFMLGFNQAAERFIMVDVGSSKEAADAKLKGELAPMVICRILKLFLDIQFILKITFVFPTLTRYSSEVGSASTSLHDSLILHRTGCHDNGYVHNLRSVVTSGLGDKLVLMPGYSDIAIDIKALQLPELRVPELFLSTKLVVPPYNAIATVPPPGLAPTTPKLSAAVQPISPPAAPPGLDRFSGDGLMARRQSQSYKSVLQAPQVVSGVRYGSPGTELSESSESSEASEIPLRFPRLTPPSPPRQRRITPQLVSRIVLIGFLKSF